jgi:hypothetical protein
MILLGSELLSLGQKGKKKAEVRWGKKKKIYSYHHFFSLFFPKHPREVEESMFWEFFQATLMYQHTLTEAC